MQDRHEALVKSSSCLHEELFFYAPCPPEFVVISDTDLRHERQPGRIEPTDMAMGIPVSPLPIPIRQAT